MNPSKPTLLFDGDCHFCRRWVMRWQRLTGDRVTYRVAQEAGADFPQIAPEALRRSVQLMETDGSLYAGAAAVFRTLTYAPFRGWLYRLYRFFPPFRWISEKFYASVASHRVAYSRITTLLWGKTLEPPTYALSGYFFLRALGLIYLIAFVSFWVQMPGLIGQNGILPAERFLQAVQEHYGAERFWLLPTLGWISAGNAALHLYCALGVVFAILLAIGICPVVSCLALWFSYLSLVSLGQTFMSFQWDILLLECGFLGIFLSRWEWFQKFGGARPPPALMVGLFQWLLFRLMFRSGVAKLVSGDVAWKKLTALAYHYETQPLPTWVGWYAHQLPEWAQQVSAAGMFAVELAMPFLILGPRRLKMLPAVSFIGLMLVIMITGNYCFFNLLTIMLCFFLFDDAIWPDKIRARLRDTTAESGVKGRWPAWIIAPLTVCILVISATQMIDLFRKRGPWPQPIAQLRDWSEPFHSINRYGLFAVMTKERFEILLEGSEDSVTWKPYTFRWKPGDLDHRPGYIAPHQPRLDWQMWFAALGSYRQNPWLLNTMVRLLQGEKAVVNLLEANPFAASPPHYMRAVLYLYEFTDRAEKKRTGHWWKRTRKGLYAPALVRNGEKIGVMA